MIVNLSGPILVSIIEYRTSLNSVLLLVLMISSNRFIWTCWFHVDKDT